MCPNYEYKSVVIPDLIYPGEVNNISINHQYTARFTCTFDLYVYPFDVQECSIDLRLPWTYEGLVQFSRGATAGMANYTGPTNLALYTVSNVVFETVADPGYLRLKFELHRRQGFVLLSTFVPSVLLLLVSWATLFVKLEAMNVRCIMSLTTLLVLYTLFSNLSSSMPNTAAIKLIDIYFFYIIVLLFLNIMVHIFVEFLVQRFTTAHRLGTKGQGKGQGLQGMPQMITVAPMGMLGKGRVGDNMSSSSATTITSPTALTERVISIYRSIVVPSAFIIFVVTYGIMIVYR